MRLVDDRRGVDHTVETAEEGRIRRAPVGLRYVAAVTVLLTAAGSNAAVEQARQLHVTPSPAGRVVSADRRIACGRDCSSSYAGGRVVALAAVAAPGASFKGWTGDCVGTAPRCAVVMDRNVRVGALFVRRRVRLTLTVSGSGSIYSEPERLACGAIGGRCTASFGSGTLVILSPVPSENSTFRAWGAACKGKGRRACSLRVTGLTEVNAAFESSVAGEGPQRLGLDVTGARVSSRPSGLACPARCSAFFPPGTLVTLRGSGRYTWGGACTGLATACLVVADRSHNVTVAGPAPPPPPPPAGPPPPAPARSFGLDLSVSGRGVVLGGRRIHCGRTARTVLACAARFRGGERVQLRAVPARGSRFVRWGGACRGRDKRCTVRVSAPKIATAIFGRRAG